MKNTFFTADTHWGHQNIIKYVGRPFSSIEEHDETLISNWNSVVKNTDDVYHLGDVGMCDVGHLKRILQRLNGRIFLIKGNHEKPALHRECIDRFEWVKDIFTFTHQDKKYFDGEIILCHYAMRTWDKSHYGTYHLYGHTHGKLKDEYFDTKTRSMDCGVDTNNYYPYSLDDIVKIMNTRKFEPIGKRE